MAWATTLVHSQVQEGGEAVSEHECTEHLLDEIQRLREENFYLREGAEGQRQRIKRLEEAGDKAILNSYLPDRLAVWNKAKEAKP